MPLRALLLLAYTNRRKHAPPGIGRWQRGGPPPAIASLLPPLLLLLPPLTLTLITLILTSILRFRVRSRRLSGQL